jgi:hypothetical protein
MNHFLKHSHELLKWPLIATKIIPDLKIEIGSKHHAAVDSRHSIRIHPFGIWKLYIIAFK